jgi:type IV pilus assembly protein PilM
VFGRKKAAIGLDVGTYAIKVVEITFSGSLVTVTNAGYEEIPSAEARADALKKLVAEKGLKGQDVVSSVAGRSVIVRYVNLRKMDRGELRNAIRFEADKYIPFSIDEVVLDCQPIEGADNVGADEMKVLLVAVKRNLIEEHVSLLRSSGVNPVIIDVDGFALGNAHLLASKDGTGAGVRALIDIGASKTNINVVEGARSLFTREVYVGGADFSAEISRRLAVNPFEVEKLKANPGDKANELHEAVQTVTDDLGNEVRLSLDFFENEFDRPVGSVVLSGGGSRLSGLVQALEQNFKKPTQLWDPASAFALSLAHGGEEVFREKAAQMAISLGLAARLGRS